MSICFGQASSTHPCREAPPDRGDKLKPSAKAKDKKLLLKLAPVAPRRSPVELFTNIGNMHRGRKEEDIRCTQVR